MMMHHENTLGVSFSINGRSYSLPVPRSQTLLITLRETLDLTGVKPGCNTGDCGACKVLVDGQAVNSCTTLTYKVDGKKITTIEGLARGRELHPIQESFIDAGAVQCGYCTPGMVLTAKSLLDSNANPSRQEILEAVDPNLCRCTGYKKIVDAIELAASRLGSEAESCK